MKIRDIRVYPTWPGIQPHVRGSRPGWLFVEVTTDEGITGVGECSNWPRKGNYIVARILETLKDVLVGRDTDHIEDTWRELYRNYTYLGGRGPITTVISGIDIALWDIKGKALGRPVYDLLGGPVRPDIPLYTHPRAGTPEEVAESALALVEQGFTAVKTDPFFPEMGAKHTSFTNGWISRRGIRYGASIIEAMRKAVGPEVEILIDAHGNFNVPSAIDCARALQPYGITWFEEPVPPESYDALAQVCQAVDVDICVGERLYTRWDFLPVLQNRLADYIMPDVCWTGGITELKKIATLAETFYVPVSPHNAMGPVQIVAGAQVMMTVPNFYRLEMASLWMDLYNSAINPPLDVREGALHLSDRPGLGVELNQDWVQAHLDPAWR